MELNNKFFKGARGANRIISAVSIIIFGLIAIGIGVAMFFLKTEEGGNINPIINVIVISIGVLLDVLGVVMIIKAKHALQRNKPLSEEEVKSNMAKDEPGVLLSDTKLFFHFGGKMNQSYLVEDHNKNVVYDVKLARFNPIGNNVYEFINHKNGATKSVKVGKVMTSSSDGFGVDMMNTSSFRIDGVNCWDYLRNRGYEIHHLLDGETITRYEITHLGKEVASIVPTTMKDPWNEKKQSWIRMGKGIYRLEISEAKLDDIVMIAFIVSRVDIVE